ncbi:MAG: ParA family protein [Myxococcota bacterium]|nr:ParA family protein [Myxococcota bacterium]
MPRRIAFINEKGGSGKTTLVANLAYFLAHEEGLRTLAIDMDPQGQLGKVLGLDVHSPRRSAVDLLLDSFLRDGDAPAALDEPTDRLPVMKTRVPNLDVIVSNKSLALFPAWAGNDLPEDPSALLQERLDRASELREYDVVLFDAPPSFGPLTLNVLRACTDVVIPVPLTYLALDGCAELVKTLELVRRRYRHPDLAIRMVVPTFYRRTRMAKEILEALRDRFPREISKTVIGFTVKIDEAQSRGLTIFETAPRHSGARTLSALGDELLERLRSPVPPPASPPE